MTAQTPAPAGVASRAFAPRRTSWLSKAPPSRPGRPSRVWLPTLATASSLPGNRRMRRWVGRHRALGAALAVCLVLVGGALIVLGLGSSGPAAPSPYAPEATTPAHSVTDNGSSESGSPRSSSDGSSSGGYAGGEASSSITPLGLITALTGLVSALAGLLAAWVALRTSLRTSALAQSPDSGGKAAT